MIYPKNKPINAYIPNFTGDKSQVSVYEEDIRIRIKYINDNIKYLRPREIF